MSSNIALGGLWGPPTCRALPEGRGAHAHTSRVTTTSRFIALLPVLLMTDAQTQSQPYAIWLETDAAKLHTDELNRYDTKNLRWTGKLTRTLQWLWGNIGIIPSSQINSKIKCDKKAVLSQRRPRDARYISGSNEPLRRYGHSKLSKMAALDLI